MSRKRVSGCVEYIGVILFLIPIAVLVFSIGIRIFDSQGIQRREQGLLSEFQAILHPTTAEQISFQMKSKIIKMWIIAEYKYELDGKKLELYYDQELLNKGWSKVPISKEEYLRFHYFKYKKGDYEIIFRPYKDSWLIEMHLRDFYDKFG